VILADTSVWIAHFRSKDERLTELASARELLIHPMVILEIGCGTPPARRQTINDLLTLPTTELATWSETLEFAEAHALYGRGCGAIDLQILASVLITPQAKLWTIDKRLEALAQELGVAYALPLH
jgi:predicted nucleic acid-binding protein